MNQNRCDRASSCPCQPELFAASVLASSLASADPWLAAGDEVLRHDIEMLADAGVIKGPITQWPIPWPDIARTVTALDQLGELTGGEQAAFSRLKRAAHVMMRTRAPGPRAGFGHDRPR